MAADRSQAPVGVGRCLRRSVADRSPRSRRLVAHSARTPIGRLEACRPVDQRPAADGGAGQNRHAQVLRRGQAVVEVQPVERVQLVARHLRLGHEWPSLDNEHLTAGLCQARRNHAAARSRAHHDDVRLELDVERPRLGSNGCIDNRPGVGKLVVGNRVAHRLPARINAIQSPDRHRRRTRRAASRSGRTCVAATARLVDQRMQDPFALGQRQSREGPGAVETSAPTGAWNTVSRTLQLAKIGRLGDLGERGCRKPRVALRLADVCRARRSWRRVRRGPAAGGPTSRDRSALDHRAAGSRTAAL